jgi:hypothetical protein
MPYAQRDLSSPQADVVRRPHYAQLADPESVAVWPGTGRNFQE